ncbi:MAG: hypothetical protein Q9210_006135 [Variospora velana]
MVMAGASPILQLLAAEGKPKVNEYHNVCHRIIAQPSLISDLVDDDLSSELIFHLTHHNQRLVQLFHTLFSRKYQPSRSFPSQSIVAAIILLFNKLLQVIDVTLSLNLLLPIIRPCMMDGASNVRSMASMLVLYDDLVRRLVCNDTGAEAIKAFVFSSNPAVRNAQLQEAWAEKLTRIITACRFDHNLSTELRTWEDLKHAKGYLNQVKHDIPSSQHISNPAHIHLLSAQYRRSFISEHLEPHDVSLTLPKGLCDILGRFGIGLPSSPAQLQELIEELEGPKTLSLLRAFARTLPCDWCRLALDEGEHLSHDNPIIRESKSKTPNLEFSMDVFGQSVGIWDVLLSTPALSTLQERQQAKTAGSLEGKLTALSRGHRHKSSRLAGSKSMKSLLQVPAFKTRYERGHFILWQIDLVEDRESRKSKQVLRVWAIVRGAGINTILEHVGRTMQSTYSAEKVRRCRQVSRVDGNVTSPIAFEEDNVNMNSLANAQTSLDVRSMNPILLDLVDKFYAFTQPVLQSQIIDSMTPELLYQLSGHEMDVICYWESASLILGRSGTGKTTCLIFKLIGKYLASKRHPPQRPIRQIVLTRSRDLVDKLRTYIRSSIRTISRSDEDASSDPSDPQTHHLDVSRATVLSLTDDHYPVVCTYEDFLRLLENTAAIARGQSPVIHHSSENHHEQEAVPSHRHQADSGGCVDFSAFKQIYWPKISAGTSRLPLPLVFAEIMGVIKGSASSIDTLGPLSLDDYLNASSRIAPLFILATERTEVYRAFEQYEKLKRLRSEFDYVDRVIDLLRATRTDPTLQKMMASSIEELYIDEIQDHRSIDIALFLSLMRDSRGFHVAGDTAQAISQDATLRFADIKALVYRHFGNDIRSKSQKQHTHAKMFQLGINYRSHHGIVALAAFVMEILWKAFPNTVDKLAPEAGHFQGPLPIIFTGCGPEILSHDRTSSAEALSGSTNFGADQVVLVRDEEAKNQLRSAAGNVGLTLTILQSKGMEFGDVKLVNFLSTCVDPGGLRRLPALMGAGNGAFNCEEHAAMCNELKQLYVAITRAQSRLFIVESLDEKELMPILQMLTTLQPEPVVKVVKRNDAAFDDYVELLHTSKASTPKDWIDKGWAMIARDCYDEAIFCFEEANYQRGITVATAKKEYARGRYLGAKQDNAGATSAYETAAELYRKANMVNQAVGIFRAVGWYERAANLLLDEQGDYNEAAVLFVRAERFDQASVCYNKTQQYGKAAEALLQGKSFEAYIDYMFENRSVLSEIASPKQEATYRTLLRQKKISKIRQKKAVSLLGSPDEWEQLYRRYEMPDVLDELYLENGRFSDLFLHRLQQGHLDTAFQLLLTKSTVDELLGVPDEQIRVLIDLTLVGRLNVHGTRSKAKIPKLLHDLQKVKHSRFAKHVQQWNFALGCIAQAVQTTVSDLGPVRDAGLQLITSIQILDLATINAAQSLNYLISDVFKSAFKIVKDAIMGEATLSMPHMLTACGVWRSGNLHSPYHVASWSPLATTTKLSDTDVVQQSVRSWVIKRFTDSVQALDKVSRGLWSDAWPQRCAQFLTKGRGWLERLARELTWVSAFEQDDAVISYTIQRLRYDKELAGVAAGIEALLLFRLKREWKERREYSVLLEQLQLSTILGVQDLFGRTLHYMTRSDNQGQIIWDHMKLHKDIGDFVQGINKINMEGLQSFHSITTLFEYLATYIFNLQLVKICPDSFIIPRSWISMHLLRICCEQSHTKVTNPSDKLRYDQGLIELITSFCQVLTRLNAEMDLSPKFYVGQRSYPIGLLQQRNAEFLAVAHLNLGLGGGNFHVQKQTLGKVITAMQLRSMPQDIFPKGLQGAQNAIASLVNSTSLYHGKNPLTVVERRSVVSPLTRQLCASGRLKSVKLSDLAPANQSQLSQQPPLATNTDSNHQLIDRQTASTQQLQKWWRRLLPLRKQQQHLCATSTKHRRIAHYQHLTATLPRSSRLRFRAYLISHGLRILSDLTDFQQKNFALRASISDAFAAATETSLPALEECLTRCESAQEMLSATARDIDDEKLKVMIDGGDSDAMKAHLERVRGAVESATREMLDVEVVLRDING